MRLVVSLPTRGRPDQLIRTVTRNMACLSREDTLLMVQADHDDLSFTRDVSDRLLSIDTRVRIDVRGREDTVAAKWNRAFGFSADLYLCLGDDDPLATRAADEKLLKGSELFPDGIGAVYGHMANASFPGVYAFTRKLVDLMGYIQPEYFPYWFCDHWTDDLCRMIGRIIMVDVRTDQSSVGRTQEMREPSWWATWFDANYINRRGQAYAIIDALDEPQWRKEMLKSATPLVEYRSRFINDTVRNTERAGGFGALTGGSLKDERYLRIKERAIAAVPGVLATLPQTEAVIYKELLTPPRTIPNLQRAYG